MTCSALASFPVLVACSKKSGPGNEAAQHQGQDSSDPHQIAAVGIDLATRQLSSAFTVPK